MHGRLISNTGPVIALSAVDQLAILRMIFDEVIVSESVHAEIIRGGRDFAGLACYQRATWIKVKPIAGPIEPLLKSLLDEGEASVIQLAREELCDFVLIDEKKARKIARRVYGMQVVGSARILVEAKRRGMLPSVREALEGMRSAGYWIHDDIVNAAIEQASE